VRRRILPSRAERALTGEKAREAEAGVPASVAKLVPLAAEEELDPGLTRRSLEAGSYSGAVRAGENQARTLGITGVPFCVVDGKYGVSGAQPVETFTPALRQAWGSR
jgi:predicted DsbA family dithiol-disulfide isomerase